MLKSMSRCLALPLFILAILVTGCSEGSVAETNRRYPMASLEQLPSEVRQAPLSVQLAYQFASANPDILQGIPCYCGCGAMGHTSNYACYVSSVDAQGQINYDPHALGCSICVDITQDTMRLLNQGKSVSEIKAYVDQTYSKYGPSNMP